MNKVIGNLKLKMLKTALLNNVMVIETRPAAKKTNQTNQESDPSPFSGFVEIPVKLKGELQHDGDYHHN